MPAPATPETSGAAITSARHPLALFFDGECCFCNRWVLRLMKADNTHRTRFGPKQGRTFQALAQAHPEVARVDSVVLLMRDPDGREKTLVRSAAILAVIDGLRGFGFFAAVLRVVPRPLSDLGYAIFSKMRGLLFGTNNECEVAQPDDPELFLP